MQSLRFVSEAAQDMTSTRSLLSRSDTEGKTVPNSDVESDTDEADFVDIFDTRSEVSHYHDCQSEGGCSAAAHQASVTWICNSFILPAGMSSSSASQVDPMEEGKRFTRVLLIRSLFGLHVQAFWFIF